MTLFTANGLLLGTTRGMLRGIMGKFPSYIYSCYKDWYLTQTEEYPLRKSSFHYTWLVNVPKLFFRRAPGCTCLSAIGSGKEGSMDRPLNDSKGCGGVMRVAPIGLYLPENEHIHTTQEDRDLIGAQTAALTHGHSLGYIPAAALVHIVSLASHNEKLSLLEIIEDMQKTMEKLFGENPYLPEFQAIIDKAVTLSKQDLQDTLAIREIGEGWVAEETLAIAIYCALKYSHDFDKALIASVNHDGDSDSTGAVTGNILGAYLGLQGIPKKYIDKLELKDLILEMADDLFNDCKMSEFKSYHDEIWMHKYVDAIYQPITNQDTLQAIVEGKNIAQNNNIRGSANMKELIENLE